ncbi:MAG: TerB family tellurite resistance protein [Gemmatimonadota bacterium]|nr:TerB family tellurite resistance protein [Gemmatimonadota bacterium]
MFAALGGFLSHRTAVRPVTVWLLIWSTNAGGAILLYYVTRRWGGAFVRTRLGKRLLPPSAIAAMEQEYLRFGVIGIFLSRLLPGFRSFVAPFAGLVKLPALKAVVPIILAAGLWYGGLVWIGVRLGGEWETIQRLLGRINGTLGILAAAAIAAIIITLIRRRRRRRDDRLWGAIEEALGHDSAATVRARTDPRVAAVASLLVEVARADHALGLEERMQIEEAIHEQWGLPVGPAGGGPSRDTAEYASKVSAAWERPARLRLIQRLREVAYADRRLVRHEERLIARAAELLGLSPDDLADVPPPPAT